MVYAREVLDKTEIIAAMIAWLPDRLRGSKIRFALPEFDYAGSFEG